MPISDDIKQILFDEKSIKERVAALGEQISRDYAGKSALFLCVLKGASPFFCDLLRRVDCDRVDVREDFISASSYGNNAKSSGNVNISSTIDFNPKGKDVVIVDDICDTGKTVREIKRLLIEKGALSVKTCCAVNRGDENSVDYFAFASDERDFLVGYGLDYAEKYRALPYIASLKEEVIK